MIIDTTCSVMERKIQDAKPFIITEQELEDQFSIGDFSPAMITIGDPVIHWTTTANSNVIYTYFIGTCNGIIF